MKNSNIAFLLKEFKNLNITRVAHGSFIGAITIIPTIIFSIAL